MKILCYAGLLMVATLAPTGARAGSIQLEGPTNGSAEFLHTSVSYSWKLFEPAPFVFEGGTFTMKLGPHTTGDVTLAIWQGDPEAAALASGTSGPAASTTLGASAFSQQWRAISFLFAPQWFSANTPYTVTLTSNAVSAANSHFFIRAPLKAELTGSNGDGPIPPSEVPEPASWGLLAGGAVLIALSRRFRNTF